MWVIVALVVIGADPLGLFHSNQRYASKEACEDAVAERVESLRKSVAQGFPEKQISIHSFCEKR